MSAQLDLSGPTAGHENRGIYLKVCDAGSSFVTLIPDRIVALPPAGGNQCLPLYYYIRADKAAGDDLFGADEQSGYVREDAIADESKPVYTGFFVPAFGAQ